MASDASVLFKSLNPLTGIIAAEQHRAEKCGDRGNDPCNDLVLVNHVLLN